MILVVNLTVIYVFIINTNVQTPLFTAYLDNV